MQGLVMVRKRKEIVVVMTMTMEKKELEPVADEPVVGEQGILLCPYYFASGQCAVPNCMYTHGEQCPSCLRFCMTDANREEHLDYCIEGVEENAQLAELREGSKHIECGICFEIVLEKVNRAERRYVRMIVMLI